MSIGERWLIATIIVLVAIVLISVIWVNTHNWVRSRRARDTNKRINRLP